MKKFLIDFSNCDIIKADKMLHFSFEFVLTVIFAFFLSVIGFLNNRKIILIIFVIALAIAKELFDKYYKPNGKWDWFDIYYGVAGGLLYVLISDYL